MIRSDEQADYLEKWPAHARGRLYASSNVAIADGRLVVLSEVETSSFGSVGKMFYLNLEIPNLVPKPKFLETLELEINKRLTTLKSSDVDGRLQIYKEGFKTFIATFKTYQPFLAQIYKEYEEAFNFYKTEAQKLRPVKEYLWTITQECDERVLRLQKRERPELDHLKREIIKLRSVISEQKEDKISLTTEVERLSRALEEEHARYRHESDAKHLLISEINALRNQYNEMEDLAKQAQNKISQEGDPTLLKMALEAARKAQSASDFEVIRLKAEYVDVVPKSHYDVILEENENLRVQNNKLQQTNQELTELLREKEEQIKELIIQRDEYHESLQQMKRASTPRPEWNDIGRKIPSGLNQWLEDTRSMSTQQKMHHLIEELTVHSNKNNQDFTLIPPKGRSDSVPRFLHADVDIHCRLIQLRDCLLLNNEIWIARKNEKEQAKEAQLSRKKSLSRRRGSLINQIKTQGSKSPKLLNKTFNEFMDYFFKQNFPTEQIRLEWAYGFYHYLNKHTQVQKFIETKKIIDNEMDETCHWHLESWFNWIRDCLETYSDVNQIDSENSPNSEKNFNVKSITKQNFFEVMGNLFGTNLPSSAEHVTEFAYEYAPLKQKLENDTISISERNVNENKSNSNELINIEKLFENFPGEDYNPFMCQLISIYKSLKSSFIKEISIELQKLVSNENQSKSISAAQLRHTIETISPPTAVTANVRPRSDRSIPIILQPIELESSIDWVFRPNMTEQSVSNLPLTQLLTRIEGGNFFQNTINL